MIGKRMMLHVNIWPRTLLLAFLLLLPGSLRPAQAQVTLSLSPSTTSAAQGSTIQFLLYLTGGANVGSYTTGITVDNLSLSFVNNSPPFTSTFSGPNQFRELITNSITTNTTTSATTQTLNIAYATANGDAAVNNTGPTELGYFSVLVGSSATPGPASLTVAAPVAVGSTDAGPSSVQNDTNFQNELTGVSGATVTITAAPEPAQSAMIVLFIAGLGGLLWRARKRRKIGTP